MWLDKAWSGPFEKTKRARAQPLFQGTIHSLTQSLTHCRCFCFAETLHLDHGADAWALSFRRSWRNLEPIGWGPNYESSKTRKNSREKQNLEKRNCNGGTNPNPQAKQVSRFQPQEITGFQKCQKKRFQVFPSNRTLFKPWQVGKVPLLSHPFGWGYYTAILQLYSTLPRKKKEHERKMQYTNLRVAPNHSPVCGDTKNRLPKLQLCNTSQLSSQTHHFGSGSSQELIGHGWRVP